MISRRGFLGTAAVLASATAVSGRVRAASIPEAPSTKTSTMQPPIFPTGGPDYQPVVTLNGWTLPWRMNGDWKEFHLWSQGRQARKQSQGTLKKSPCRNLPVSSPPLASC